jgi:lysyl endopeptidase
MKIKNIATALPLLLVFSIARAMSVETVQTNRGKAKNPVSGFSGQSQAFDLVLPYIRIDLKTTIPGLHKSGTVYRLPTPLTSLELDWESADGGYIARIHVASAQAKRLRLHLVFGKTSPSLTFRLQGSMDVMPLAPIDQSLINKNGIWLPATKGNAADLEIFVNETNPPFDLFTIDAVNIIVAGLSIGGKGNSASALFHPNDRSVIIGQSLGLAQAPEYDLTCWAGSVQYPALQQAASATPVVEFIKNLNSYICSGTLLTDTRHSMTPWFITANHCIGNQATANTATFQWFDQAQTCLGSTTDSRDAQTSGGAQVLWTNVKNDTTLMKLRVPPPAGVAYIGWDTGRLKVGATVWGIHHPKGDQTMVSLGNVLAVNSNVTGEDGVARLLNMVEYHYGGTEDGSSGSGLFVMEKGKAKWRGALYGGPLNDYQNAVYSDFSGYYPNIEYWLTGQSLKRRKILKSHKQP